MPGWTTGDNWHNNIAYTPGTWIALHRICEKHGVGDQLPHPLRPVARDPDGPGHALDLPVPEGRGLRLPDRRLPRQGPGDRREGRLGLGLRRADRASAATGRTGRPSPNPADQVNAWKKQVVLCEHELPGTARHDPLAYLQNRTVDWLDHQLAARELLELDVANTHLVVEHEYPKARIQDKERLAADPAGLDRLHAQDRRGRGLHVRAAARGARGPGHPGAGPRPGGVPELRSARNTVLHRFSRHSGRLSRNVH